MSGIKLTVFLPVLNNQLRNVVSNVSSSESPVYYTLILCHSFLRCNEIETFIKELTHFCSDFVDVLNLNSADSKDNLIAFKQSLTNKKSDSDTKALFLSKNKVIITTPN